MPLRPQFVRARRTAVTAVLLLLACELGGAPTLEGALAAAVPERCFGYGGLLSISRTDWESGLGSWTAATQDVANPATFGTPNWATRGNLPDGRPGAAAFVPNLLIGDCVNDDETGVLILTSPSITIPGGTAVPRVSIDHWFQTEHGWDGGQFRVSVGNGPFNLIPASAIEIVPYNDTLFPALDEWGDVFNSNPFADQNAYTRTNDAQPTGEWVQSRINLRGIASAGNSIRVRAAFGLDSCTVALPTEPTPVGWFVDEVEVYRCQAEPAPSNCGNGVINGGEQCDDGNNYIGDGCSNTCQVESGWQCAAPTPAGTIGDPGFEAGRPNPFWYEVSNNPIGSPICNAGVCGTGGGSGPYQGTYWVFLGGLSTYQEGSVSQAVVIPTHVTRMTFQLEIPRCDSAADYVELLIDGNIEWRADGSSALCGKKGYTEQTVDVTAYADGGSHLIEFYSRTLASNGDPSNFFIDQVALPANPSACRRVGTSLTLVKDVINDNGGTALRSAWNLSASGPSTFNGPGPVVWGGPSFQPGTYDLSEGVAAPGYSASNWHCKGGTQIDGDTVTVAEGEAVTCTITNDDIAPTLTLVNTIVNDSGGTVTNSAAFGLSIDGEAAPHGTPTTVRIGDRRVSAVGLPGYQLSTWGGDCDADGFVQLSLGQNAVCTITSNDIAPTLAVFKTIVNDHGGTVSDPNAFGLKIDGQPVSHAVANPVSAGTRIVSETGLPGYVASAWGGDCTPSGAVSLALAENATCTVTNNDAAPSLTLVKQVINDHGGTALPSAWTLTATGPTPLSGNGPSVSSGPNFVAGSYQLSESGGATGYTSGAWVCIGGQQVSSNTVNLLPGVAAVCTSTSNDVGPTLTLFKNIVNDNGGTVTDRNAFGLRIDGVPTLHNVAKTVVVGTHSASEVGLPGYQAGSWSGACNPDGSVTLALGQNAICSITNNDIAPTLTVVKNIVNDDEGTVTNPNDFGLKINGSPVLHNAVNALNAGTHTVAEAGLPGYVASPWGGDCNPDGSITLALGQNATCSVTNDDLDTISLTLVKVVVNNNGGTAQPSDWTLSASGPTGFSGSGPSVSSGAGFGAGTYHLSESGGAPGYNPRPWECVGGTQLDGASIALQPGDTAICTITNDDITPTLRLQKSITNDDGGTVTNPSDFYLRVNGFRVFHNQTNAFPAGNHMVSEDGLPGYQPGTWGGACNPDGSITLTLGQAATCTITNNDIAPTLTLVKTIVNDEGGTVTNPDAFGLQIDGEPVLHEAVNEVSAGYHFVSEAGLPGYQAGSWEGDCNPDGSIILSVGQDATCEVTNDDTTATSLVLVKAVINDSGGTALASDWILSADGETAFSGPGPLVESPIVFQPGSYVLSETDGPSSGYATGNWVCVGGSQSGNTIELEPGEAATCTITSNDIAPTLTVSKSIVNNNGGTIVDENLFGLRIDGVPVTHDTANAVAAGAHTVSEVGLPGYQGGAWGGDCNANGTITLALAQSATCSITNNDIAPSLTLVKQVTNDSGGTAAASAWTMTATGPSSFSGPGPSVSNGANFQAGTYTLSESGGPGGYSASAWVCVGGSQNGASITLTPGQSATCTITNNDIAPSLTLVKQVVNNNGGSAVPANWTLMATGPSSFSGPGPSVSNGAGFKAGTYILSESVGPDGYSAGPWDCDGGSQNGSSITLTPGQSATCTIINDDVGSGLTLVKQVVNDNGGTAVPANWTLSASGTSGFSGAGPSVSSGANFQAGTYTLSESTGPGGYTASAWSCTGGSQNGNQITLTQGQSATCTITNNDNAPSLTLNKVVTNNNGGTALPSAWTLTASGPRSFSGAGPSVSNGAGFKAGTYTLSESGPTGYGASAWVCVGGSQSGASVTLTPGQSATCTITNNDIPPSLTLNKVVTNNNGGTALPSAWTLSAAGPTPLFGPGAAGTTDVQSGPSFAAGTYTLSESAGSAGYTASAWSCSGGSQNGNQVTLTIGQSATCTITNNDIPPSLKLNKVVTNNNGGTSPPSAWTLSAAGPTPLSGPGAAGSIDVQSGPSFAAGTYTLSESTGPAGYTASAWSCTGGSQNGNQITLTLGQSATCTITNDDNGPRLTLVKEVVNDNGGSALASAWTLTASGPTILSGSGPTVSSGIGFKAGTYTLSESGGPGGYSASAWVCVGGSQSGASVTLALGVVATCKITNDDIPPTLTVSKNVVNDNGGMVTSPNAFGLKIDGAPVLHGAANEVSAGSHTVSEDSLPGYQAGSWGGHCAADGTVNLSLGQNATCTITNNDIPPTLTLVKQVVNNNGGNAVPANWTLMATGPSSFSGAGPSVSNGAGFKAGTYTLSESGGPSGYSAGPWVCVGGSQNGANLTLTPGQSASCTIINDDEGTGLTLVKQVVNDNGGTAVPANWTLSASGTGGATVFSGPGPSVSSGVSFQAGTFTLSESTGPGGYSASAWVCVGGSQSGASVTLTPGQSATCTITNNDLAPGLTLVKQVINDNGGTAVPANWTLTATGPSSFSGAGPSVANGAGFKAGTYTLSESTGPAGYSASAWVCVGGSQIGASITLTPGQSATCTITNNDQPLGEEVFKDGFE